MDESEQNEVKGSFILKKPFFSTNHPNGENILYVKEQKRLFLCPQTFIVKIRIILFGCTSMIYSGTERRGNRLVVRETERECVCAT